MAEIIPDYAPLSIESLKAPSVVAVNEVDQLSSNDDSDISTSEDAMLESGSVLIMGEDEDPEADIETMAAGQGIQLSINKVRESQYYSERRVVSRTTSRSSTTVSSENISKAEHHFTTMMEFVSSATREASSLKEFWNGITSEYYETISERNELYKKVIELGDECDRYIGDKDRHDRLMKQRMQMIQKLNKTLAEALKSVEREKRRLGESEDENKRIRKQLHEAGHKYTHIENERNNLVVELGNANARIRIIIEERDSSRRAYDELDVSYHALIALRDELQAQVDDLESQYKLAKLDVIRLTNRLASTESLRQELSDRCGRLTIDIEKISADLRTSSASVLEWTTKYVRCKNELDKQLVIVGDLGREKTELSRTIKLVIQERDMLKTQTSEHQRTIEQLQRDNESLSRQLETSNEEYQKVVTKNERLQGLLRDSNSKRQSLVDELNRLKREHSDLKNYVLTIDEQIIRQDKTIKSLQEERLAFKERAEDAESDAAEQHRRCGIVESELDILRGEYTEMEQKLIRVTEERDQFEQDLQDAQSGSSGNGRLIRQLRERIAVLDHECKQIIGSKLELEAQIEIIRKERNLADESRDIISRKWDEKCRQVERMLREGIYCPCKDHEIGIPEDPLDPIDPPFRILPVGPGRPIDVPGKEKGKPVEKPEDPKNPGDCKKPEDPNRPKDPQKPGNDCPKRGLPWWRRGCHPTCPGRYKLLRGSVFAGWAIVAGGVITYHLLKKIGVMGAGDNEDEMATETEQPIEYDSMGDEPLDEDEMAQCDPAKVYDLNKVDDAAAEGDIGTFEVQEVETVEDEETTISEHDGERDDADQQEDDASVSEHDGSDEIVQYQNDATSEHGDNEGPQEINCGGPLDQEDEGEVSEHEEVSASGQHQVFDDDEEVVVEDSSMEVPSMYE